MSMKIKKSTKNGYTVFKLVGDASSEETYKLSKVFEETRAKGVERMAIDLSETSFIDSSTLGVLIFNWKVCKQQKGELCLVSVNAYMQDLLKNSKLDTVFRIVENEDQL